jgi:hypothetical protein
MLGAFKHCTFLLQVANYLIASLVTNLVFWFCSASLASLTRESGPQVVKGDPARKRSPPKSVVAPRLDISDSALKFTHVLYNLSPSGRVLIFSALYTLIYLLPMYVVYSLVDFSSELQYVSCHCRLYAVCCDMALSCVIYGMKACSYLVAIVFCRAVRASHQV